MAKFDVRDAHRSEIVAHLEQIKTAKPPVANIEEYTQETWRSYGRVQRPKRMMRVLLQLIERAEHQETITYKELFKETGTNAFHENMHVIKLLGEFCRAHNLPSYPVLIKQETGRVGAGFFTEFGISGTPAEMQAAEDALQNECFTTATPTAVEVLCAAIIFIDKRNLGRP